MVHFAHSKSEKVNIRVAQILKALSTTIIKSKKTAELITSRAASYKENSQKGEPCLSLVLLWDDVMHLHSKKDYAIFLEVWVYKARL